MARVTSILLNLACAGMFCFSLSGCTITETINDILSSTSSGNLFTGDGMLKADQKINAFIAFNFENITQDMAQGRGEYLTSLSTLMNIPEDHQASFFANTQSRYPVILAHRGAPQEILALLKDSAGN
jgi:hypothetical protein